jgi:FixJ family two-component response regulator
MQVCAIEAGALGFLGKPFDSSKLVELIDKALEVGRKT